MLHFQLALALTLLISKRLEPFHINGIRQFKPMHMRHRSLQAVRMHELGCRIKWLFPFFFHHYANLYFVKNCLLICSIACFLLCLQTLQQFIHCLRGLMLSFLWLYHHPNFTCEIKRLKFVQQRNFYMLTEIAHSAWKF